MGRSHKRSRSRDRSANGRRVSHDSHSSSHDSHKKKKRNKRRSRSRDRCERACPTETLCFDALNLPATCCQKEFLAVDSSAITPTAWNAATFAIQTGLKRQFTHEAVVGISSRKLVVSWEFVQPTSSSPPPFPTKFIINVDKVVGCNFNPLVKFQVPLTRIAIDECHQLPTSQLSGASQAFNVQCCVGDLLAVSIVQTVEDPCAPGPCDPQGPPYVPPAPTGLEVALVKLILF